MNKTPLQLKEKHPLVDLVTLTIAVQIAEGYITRNVYLKEHTLGIAHHYISGTAYPFDVKVTIPMHNVLAVVEGLDMTHYINADIEDYNKTNETPQ